MSFSAKEGPTVAVPTFQQANWELPIYSIPILIWALGGLIVFSDYTYLPDMSHLKSTLAAVKFDHR